jgi:triacylglycerol lipase
MRAIQLFPRSGLRGLCANCGKNYWGGDTTANWIEAIVSIAGVLNGSLLTYIACDEQSGKVRGLASDFIGDALKILAKVHAIGDQSLYNLQLDQWIGPSDGSLATLKQKIDTTDFIGGEDNLGFDITLQGCHKANVAFGQRVATPSTYYLSLVTSASREPPLPGISFPTMNILLRETATYQEQRNDFAIPPIPDWGVVLLSQKVAGDCHWESVIEGDSHFSI